MRFHGRTALITGSTSGLGEAVARQMVAEGLEKLVITGRDQTRGEAVVQSIVASDTHCDVAFIPAELEVMDSVSRLAEEAIDFCDGRIHHLVNSAAYTGRSTIADETPEGFDYMFATNVRAPYFLMQAVARSQIAANAEGSMVNVLSMSGHGGQSFLSSYVGSKAALTGLTKNTAFALLKNRIRVNGLNIGWMDTPGEARIQQASGNTDPDWLAKAEPQQPTGRLLKPEEVARMICFLLSDESGMTTGSIIDMDQQINGCGDGHPPRTGRMEWGG